MTYHADAEMITTARYHNDNVTQLRALLSGNAMVDKYKNEEIGYHATQRNYWIEKIKARGFAIGDDVTGDLIKASAICDARNLGEKA